MRVSEVVLSAAQRLSPGSPSARLDAELLLAHVLGLTRAGLHARFHSELSAAQCENYEALLSRRLAHEPLAYITGHKEFFGLKFAVSPAVLVPRPDTETLVELALSRALKPGERVRMLELGVGSGAIAFSIAKAYESNGVDCEIVAIDISVAALDVAKLNYQELGLKYPCSFIESDWCQALPKDQKFDLIVSNPPYVESNSTQVSPELRFEPQQALYAGATGLDAIKTLLLAAPQHLAADGWFLCEFGAQQRQAIEQLLLQSPWREACQGLKIEYFRDLAGNDRCFRLSSLRQSF